MDEKRQKFVDAVTLYVTANPKFEEWSKEEIVRNTLGVLVGDIGAADAFVNAIGIDIDLYTYPG